jgi:hypothetical protein
MGSVHESSRLGRDARIPALQKKLPALPSKRGQNRRPTRIGDGANEAHARARAIKRADAQGASGHRTIRDGGSGATPFRLVNDVQGQHHSDV